jgi:MFS family permease
MVLAGAMLLGGAEAAVGLLGALGPVVVMLVLVGAGVSMIVVSARTLLQRTTDSQVLARVLAVQEGVYLIGLAVGALLGPAAVVLLGPRAAFLAFGLAISTVGLLSFRTIRPLDGQATLARREVGLLSQVGFLAMLPPYELERLAQAARWESVPAGVDVVRQGERGDAYYLIAEGRASVAVDGVLRAHTLGAGEGFGEIALLHDVDRTATVTTIVDTTLLVIDSGDFLAAVTSSADGSGMAREISRAKLESDRRAG